MQQSANDVIARRLILFERGFLDIAVALSSNHLALSAAMRDDNTSIVGPGIATGRPPGEKVSVRDRILERRMLAKMLAFNL